MSLWLAVIRKEQLLAFDFVAGDLGLTRRRGEPVAERHAHICPYLRMLRRIQHDDRVLVEQTGIIFDENFQVAATAEVPK